MNDGITYLSSEHPEWDTTADWNGSGSSRMINPWVWLVLAVAVIIFLCKFCAWCAHQNRASRSTPTRRLSSVAIIDAAAPQSITCPQCVRPEHLRTTSDEPPSYASLAPAYHEDPPPPYSSLSLLQLPTQQLEPHASNRTEDNSRAVHM